MVSMATLYMILKNGGRPTKSIVSRVLSYTRAINGTKLKLRHRPFFPVVRYVNHLICIFMNINVNMKNEVYL